jgi:hypothetical protein
MRAEIYPIECVPCGRLAIMPRPRAGKGIWQIQFDDEKAVLINSECFVRTSGAKGPPHDSP